MRVQIREAEVDVIMAYIRDRSGLVFPAVRMIDVRESIEREMNELRVSTVHALTERLDTDTVAREELLAQLTVGETYFFREHEQLDFLRSDVFPSWIGRSAHDPVRAWSAGCSSGEEAHSLAIALRESGLQGARVLGTDISRDRLATARRAHYTQWSLRGMSEVRVQNYFDQEEKHFLLRPIWREGVEFRYLNLADDVYPTLTWGVWGMDVVLCRNVLIYFDAKVVRRVAQRLLDAVRDDGWLLLGASDPVLSDYVDCTPVLTPGGLVYRRGSAKVQVAVSQPLLPPPMPARPSAKREPPLFHTRTPVPPDPPDPPGLPDPTAADAWSRRIRERANHGAVVEAVSMAALALQEHPLSAELLYLQGVLQLECGDAAEAATMARQALYADRSFISAHLLLANAQTRLNYREQAIRSLENARALLSELPLDAQVPATEEVPGRLISMIDLQLQLLEAAA